MSRALKVFALVLGSATAILLTFLLLFGLLIGTKTPPPSERFLEGARITSPDQKKSAYVYTIDSPMSFGSPSTKLCVLGKGENFDPDDDQSIYSQYGSSVIGWKGNDTLIVAIICDYHEHTDEDKNIRRQSGRWVDHKKAGEIILEIHHLKMLSSSFATFEIDTFHVRGDSLFITTTQSWSEWKYFAVNLGSVTIDRRTSLIDTLEVSVVRTRTNEKYGQPTASLYHCDFVARKPIRTRLFEGLPMRERLQRNLCRK
jgi:hypothetical protein